MRLGRYTNTINCEFKMQSRLKSWLDKKDILYRDEVHVGQVNRRADFLIIKGGKLINIEAKCNNFKCMLEQLDDHAKYCDYSFAYIPDYSLTPEWFKAELAKRKYGLMIYNYETGHITEVLESHQNKGRDKKLKNHILFKVKASISHEKLRLF